MNIHILTISSHNTLRVVPEVNFVGLWIGEVDIHEIQLRTSPLLFSVWRCELDQ